jgi:hypothetical protein
MQEEEHPPSINMFLAWLADAIEPGALVLAHHMDPYAQEVFIEFSREYILDNICRLLADPHWVPDVDPMPLPNCILTGFLIGHRNVVVTYRH